MLGDTAEAETAFHVYTSAVDALYEAFAPELEKRELHELYYELNCPLRRTRAHGARGHARGRERSRGLRQ